VIVPAGPKLDQYDTAQVYGDNSVGTFDQVIFYPRHPSKGLVSHPRHPSKGLVSSRVARCYVAHTWNITLDTRLLCTDKTASRKTIEFLRLQISCKFWPGREQLE